MRRVDRVRVEKRRRLVLTAGLAFTLGALTAGGLIWRADRLSSTVDAAFAESAPHAAAPQRTEATANAVLDPAPAATSGRDDDDTVDDTVALLRRRHLQMPVDGISPGQLQDTFDDARAGGLRRHEAIDIMAPRGTPVRAVDNGRVAKLFRSIPGGLTVYLFDSAGTFSYYYGHLDRYAEGLAEEQPVRRGDLIGYVGSTGNASEDAPHLHFAIFQLDAGRKWWQGTPINPYPVLR
jgi:murein DD-endopeptidase MepM/ murein hydrolase activator NlpD